MAACEAGLPGIAASRRVRKQPRKEGGVKALTLHQPWASLMAIGAKRVETRSWPTRHHGPLAIHAGKSQEFLTLCMEEPFKSTLLRAGLILPNDLPLGAIVAVCTLVDCRPASWWREGLPVNEAEFGDFAPGRFGWLTANMQRLAKPIPVRGAQGLWEWDEKGLEL